MDRRDLLKALGVVPFVRLPYKETTLPAVEVGAKRFIVCVDMCSFDLQEICATPCPWPDLEVEFWAVKLRPGYSVEDSIAFYDVSNEKPSPSASET